MQFHRTPSTTSPRPRVRWARRLLAATVAVGVLLIPTAAFAKPATPPRATVVLRGREQR